MEVDLIERRTLWITVVVNIVMAVAGWVTYDLTGSQAMLLDGSFSFVLAIATFIAVFISKNKHKKTVTFPYGNYVYEAAFILSKGLLIFGIVIAAFFQNLIKIAAYFQGEKTEPMVMTPIYYYTGFVLIVTFGLLWFFNWQNKKVNNQSSLLMVEATSAKIDGGLTLATGLVFFLLSYVKMGSSLEPLLYIGDSIIVILLCVAMVSSPISIIKNAFIELGGGTLQNQHEKQKIEATIASIVSDTFSFDSYISKIGSGYLVVVYISPKTKNISLETFRSIRKEVGNSLRNNYPNIAIEIGLRE